MFTIPNVLDLGTLVGGSYHGDLYSGKVVAVRPGFVVYHNVTIELETGTGALEDRTHIMLEVATDGTARPGSGRTIFPMV